MSDLRIACNSRFEDQELTGVQRYSHELLRRFGNAVEAIRPTTSLSATRAHWWEQMELPKLCGNRLLWSPGNTGPLRVARQVVTIHDASTLDHPAWFARKFALWYQFLLPRLARRVRKVITVSEFSRQRLIETCRLSPDRIVAIPNGVDDRFKPSTQEEIDEFCARHQLRQPYLVFVGSWEPRKNLSILLQSWQRSALKGFTLVLGGGVGTVFRDRGFAQIPDGVRLWGRIANEDLTPLLSGAHAFVFPSLYEGFGLPPLEAMACGCPVLISSTTSLPEVGGPSFDPATGTGSAIYFDPTDVEQLSERLREIAFMNQAARRQLAQNALARAREFTWERAASITWPVLQEQALL